MQKAFELFQMKISMELRLKTKDSIPFFAI